MRGDAGLEADGAKLIGLAAVGAESG
jgi:hypothetical protein